MRLVNKLIAFTLLLTFVFGTCSVAADEIEKAILVDKTNKITKTVDAQVNIKESNIERTVDVNRMLGAQCEIFNMTDYLLADGSLELKADLKKFLSEKLYKFPLFRWGGENAEKFNPTKNIGPLNNRKESVNVKTGTAGNGPQRLGPIEFIKFILANNTDAEMMPCLSVTHATPEDNANFVAFLTHKADESKWGALRASYGVVEPVKIFAFEIGNEVDQSPTEGWKFSQEKLDWYIPLAKSHMDAVRKVCPNAKFVVLGKTAPWSQMPSKGVNEDWRKWTVGIAKGLGEYLDYMSFHPYYDGFSVSYMDYFFDALTEDFANVMGKGNKVGIVISEHARWGTDNDPAMINFSSALSTAQFFSRMFRRSNVAAATYHNIFSVGNWWSLFQFRDGQYMESAPGLMFHVYGKGIGDRIVESSVQSDSSITDITSPDLKFTALASPKGKKELNIILNNAKEDVDLNLTFNFENEYTLVEETVFTAPNLESYVYNKNTKDVCKTTVTEKNEKNFKTYHMPNKSLVVLKLVPNKDLPLGGDEAKSESDDMQDTEAVTAKFSDIESHWAKGEISKMNELGYVSGVSETEFAPESNITRAEFSAILARILKLDGDYPNIYFNDIPDDEWYSKYVNALYCEGLIKGYSDKSFQPNAPITLEEIAVVANRVYDNHYPKSTAVDVNKIRDNFNNDSYISDWAKEDVFNAVGRGLFNRLYENGRLNTEYNATRAQTVSILYRLYNLIKS